MTSILYSVMVIVPAAVILYSIYSSFKKRMNGVSISRSLRSNVASFLVAMVIVAGCGFGVSAIEADAAPADSAAVSEEAAAAEAETDSSSKGMGLLAAAIVTSISGIGGGIAVAAGAPAAIAATSEDPKAFGKALIFVALGESIALYGVVISILILNKV